MFQLIGKRAVITGAASGIGLAIAKTFYEAGASIVLADFNADALQSVRREFPDRGTQTVESVLVDVADEGSVGNAFNSIGSSLDLLVNCAGIAHVGRLDTTAPEDFDRLYAVNVRGTYLCMRAGLPSLLRNPGSCILNMASVAATAGLSDRFAYSMTKGAVLSMTLSVAKDYLSQGLRCNCISPARVHTPFVDGFLARTYPGQEAEKMVALAKAQPIGRMGRPEEVASLALYLCSEEASFITGVDYPIDGGFSNLR